MFSENILPEDEMVLPEAGNKLKEAEIHLKNLGEGMTFVEMFREKGDPFRLIDDLRFSFFIRASLGLREIISACNGVRFRFYFYAKLITRFLRKFGLCHLRCSYMA